MAEMFTPLLIAKHYGGLLMAHETYKAGLVLSRPHHPAYDVWHPYVKVMWQDENGFHFHELVYSDVVLHTEKEATDYGLAVGRAWIDREL
jgi:hypothetical protein